MFCSFTVKAKDEALSRLKNRDKVTGATLHSLAFEHLNYKRHFMINTLAQFAKSIGQKTSVVHDMFTTGAKTPLEKSIAYYHLHRSKGHSIRIPPGLTKDTVDAYIKAFEEWKDQQSMVDYNDLFIHYLERGVPLDYDVAIIDEAQDLSPLAWRVVERMFSTARKMYAVGDDDQSIYGFAGVEAASFIHWPCDQTEVLQQSWRLGHEILGFSRQILRRISTRLEKALEPSSHPSKVRVTSDIEPLTDILPFESCVILVRNAYLAQSVRRKLDSKGVTYIGKGSPYHVRKPINAIKYWEWWRTGEQLYGRHLHQILPFVYVDLAEALGNLQATGRKALLPPIPKQFRDIAWHKALKVDHKPLFMHVEHMHGLAYLVEPPTLEITTIHQSKGGEWDKVVVMSDISAATYRHFYHGTELDKDEEHRVWYVAVTRARHELQIIRPQTTQYYPLVEGTYEILGREEDPGHIAGDPE